jgi:hypothetical protein
MILALFVSFAIVLAVFALGWKAHDIYYKWVWEQFLRKKRLSEQKLADTRQAIANPCAMKDSYPN